MIVCLCEGVTSREIDAAIRAGATTVRSVARTTGAGTNCGSCACDLKAMLRCRGSELPAAEIQVESVAARATTRA